MDIDERIIMRSSGGYGNVGFVFIQYKHPETHFALDIKLDNESELNISSTSSKRTTSSERVRT